MAVQLSVVIPVYNRERQIRRAIESCLAQPNGAFEVIVVDDASRDRSAEVAQRYSSDVVRVLRQPVNLGSTRARAAGIRAAAGDWIVRLDSDDELLPGTLQKIQSYTANVPEHVGRIGLKFRYLDGRSSPFPDPSGEILDYAGFIRWLERSETYDALTVTRRSALEAVPPIDGRLMEMIHHLDFAHRFSTLWLNDDGALYHVDAGERQSRDLPSLDEAREQVEEMQLILSRHRDELERLAPRFVRAQRRRLTVSLALADRRSAAIREAMRQLRREPMSALEWAALVAVALGKKPLSYALAWRWRWVDAHRRRACRSEGSG
jgi:glycosyltransferase involved in cell wall biosynthesis